MVFLPADGGEFFFVGVCEFRVGSLRCRDDRIVGRECGECGCVEWIV